MASSVPKPVSELVSRKGSTSTSDCLVKLVVDGDAFVVSIAKGKSKVVDASGEVDLTLETTSDQLEELLATDSSLALGFMKGDVKPVGSTGALIALIDLIGS